ncbi:hypothetical protein [Aliiroseovarius sediminis]|uniref:hypothetical protein n=1 Tax=Aliiroseovarius sediminis TaxID=2925839 RepID=UPI001F572B11|nr:hypothetical protein [Aliiroseovarius sediminis]MCI2394893.1 hypothetical protein [Aliiroseovarius sediminis]
MKLSAFILSSLLLCSSPGLAQELIGEYYAIIGPQDMKNSKGVRLTNFCAVVQQDRANFHRFGIRQDGDQSDPIFSSRKNRARIMEVCTIAPGSEYLAQWVLSGGTRYIWVRVFGKSGVPTKVLVAEGAG